MLLAIPVQIAEGIDVGRLLLTAMEEAHIPTVERWRTQGYVSEAHWLRAVQGNGVIDLRRLVRLCETRAHIRMWSLFLSRLSSALIVRSFSQTFEAFHAIRADVLGRAMVRKEWRV